MLSTLVTVMSGDPTDVLEIIALMMAELYCHAITGAGLPVAMHVNIVATPSVSDVKGCIESVSFRTTGPINLKNL